eukprot:scaffold145259_cov329-Phaeocystis_antarctica.AAC.1
MYVCSCTQWYAHTHCYSKVAAAARNLRTYDLAATYWPYTYFISITTRLAAHTQLRLRRRQGPLHRQSLG